MKTEKEIREKIAEKDQEAKQTFIEDIHKIEVIIEHIKALEWVLSDAERTKERYKHKCKVCLLH